MSNLESHNQIMNEHISSSDCKAVLRFILKGLRSFIHIKDIIIFAFLCIFEIAYNIAIPLVGKSITNYANILLNNDVKRNVMLLLSLVILNRLLSLFYNISEYLYSINSEKLRNNFKLYVKNYIVLKISRAKMHYINQSEFMDRQSYINTNSSNKISESLSSVLIVIRNLLVLITTIGIILAEYPIAVIPCLISFIPLIILIHSKNEQIYINSYWEVPEYKKMNLPYSIMTEKKYAAERLMYNYDSYMEQLFYKSSDRLLKKRNKIIKNAMFRKIVIYSIVAIIDISILYFVAADILSGLESIGLFVLMFNAIHSYFRSAMGIISGISDSIFLFKYGKYLIDMEKIEQEEKDLQLINTELLTIDIKDLHFTYPGSNEEVLRGINISIKPGERIAIIGKNGCGKSTLVNMLMGLYRPDSGKILINGVELDMCKEALRKATACIYQIYNKYEMSIRENIKVGDISRDITDEEIKEICDFTGITQFASKFEDGIDTILGSMGENGINLSGGQWQKLMIARTIARKNASLLIYDEPTAALDPKAEIELYEQYYNLTGGKTAITITHRLGITRIVDRVLVMENGRIVEDGTHIDLLKKNGVYAKMYSLQANWYE